MKVKIKNFQSVEDASLDINGFTVLVGKSNIGKSAIVRAIQGALVNTPAESYITTGKKFTEVELETPTAHILWRKGGGHNDYVINGTPLDNVGRGSVPELENMGFGELKIAGETISVQVADQWHPLFLLDAKGSLAAEAISDVGRLTEVQEALKTCDKDRREVKSTRKVREKDLEAVRESLVGFNSYPTDREYVIQAQREYTKVRDCTEDIRAVSTLTSKKERLDEMLNHLNGVNAIEIPIWEDSQSVHLKQVESLTLKFSRLSPILSHLEGVDTTVDIPSLDQLDVKHLNDLERLNVRTSQSSLQYKRYKGVDAIELPAVSFNEQDIKKLEVFSVRLGKAAKAYQRFKGVDNVDVPEYSGDSSQILLLTSFLDRLHKIMGSLPVWKEEIIALDSDLDGLKNEIHDVLHEAGICPTCDRSVE